MGVVKAVDDVTLEIRENEKVGLVGESGSGKSMTALSIMGLTPPYGKYLKGEIVFKGRNLLKLSEKEMRTIRGKEISVVFQDPMTFLNPVVKVGDQIVECIRTHRKESKEEAKKKAVEGLRVLGIPSPEKFADYYPFQLSGGMRQRVMIAMALSCNPSLLIADEPTTALDVTVQQQILALIKERVRDLKTSLLLITHDLGLTAFLCDRVYVMYAGKILEHGETSKFYSEPKHPYTIGLLKSIPTIGRFVKEFGNIKGAVPDLTNPPKGCRFGPRCNQVKRICLEEDPPAVEIEREHIVRCWLYA
jgi:oligopeptide/dipeptide ABC transporter ATP-binding protein